MFKTSSESPEGQRVTAVVTGGNKTVVKRRFCIAPKMDCSDRHARFFLRLFSDHVLLYTEMITAAAVIHGDRDHLLGFNEEEHPLAVQLGGSDPEQLFRAANMLGGGAYHRVGVQ